MYALKQIPEDFVVREVSSAVVTGSGPYLYLRMVKKGRNTLDVVAEIARRVGIREKEIGFAGSKDKQAVTEQMISMKRVFPERILALKIRDVSLQQEGYGEAPISLGDLKGNVFEIVVRKVEGFPHEVRYVENYFDEQRFGTTNTNIGKNLIRKEFKEAAAFVDDASCREHIQHYPTDYVGALKRLPLRLLRMYINAYQSYLWNETLARYLRIQVKTVKEVKYSEGTFVFVKDPESWKGLKVPLLGFAGADVSLEPALRRVVEDLMKEDGIGYADFIIKQIPELSLEGGMREAFAEVENLIIGKLENDELNMEMKKVLIRFTLPKGCYATMVIRKMFS